MLLSLLLARETPCAHTVCSRQVNNTTVSKRRAPEEVAAEERGIKAAIAALRDIPAVNAEIDGADIVYKKYYHIGVAVSAPQGLVVPVLRDADTLGFAEIEKSIAALGTKARDGKLSMEDLSSGTFTISNGGVFGSLMSTPILNPPQSGILGMHKIQERPIAIEGEIHIRPMMYLALSYDHRLIDGSEAVTFLVRIKECIEAPERLLLDL